MNCPNCGTEFDGINDLVIAQRDGAGKTPWYRPEPRKRFKCPACDIGLRPRTLLVAAIIALALLLIGILSVVYPDNRISPVLFVIALIAMGIAVPASLKRQVRLVRDDDSPSDEMQS